MSRFYLNSYVPLVASPAGIAASETLSLPPFIDGSIRREPDLEHPQPAISCLCRAGKFAPRLVIGDVVAYMTRKARYGVHAAHRRLTAILRVAKLFSDHEMAAEWYRSQQLPLPNNCMIAGNPPKPLTESHRLHVDTRGLDDERLARRWDAQYRLRASQHKAFVKCDLLFRDLSWDAPIIEDQHLLTSFGRIPCTQNPGHLPEPSFRQLMDLLQITWSPPSL